MDFEITPEEARPYASLLVERLKATGGKVTIEKAAWDDAPYRTTLYTKSGEDITLFEVQGHLNLHERLINFAQWLMAQRKCAELHLVTHADASTTVSQIAQLKKFGVGLMFLKDDNSFDQSFNAKNPALLVTLEPSLKYGDLKDSVYSCVEKFNQGGRKDGLRDLCELVERETERLLVTASRKGWTSLTDGMIQEKDWSNQINALASKGIMTNGRDAIIDAKLKDDLHSFRGARNLVDHQARTKRDDLKRQRQFPERMMMGARLIADLVSLCRKIK